jgi:hypothetical protein
MRGSLYALVRALRGPALLLTLGLLFFFEQSGVISVEKTWPILIIVLGVFRLVERAFAPPAPPSPPYVPYQPPPPAMRGPAR